jgi:hypothetical protein
MMVAPRVISRVFPLIIKIRENLASLPSGNAKWLYDSYNTLAPLI